MTGGDDKESGRCVLCGDDTTRHGWGKSRRVFLCETCGISSLAEFFASWIDQDFDVMVSAGYLPGWPQYRDRLMSFRAAFWEHAALCLHSRFEEFRDGGEGSPPNSAENPASSADS
jgi:hypothetical protein